MGSADSKLNFRKAVIQLTTKTQPVEATDDAFWDQFWADTATSVQDVFALVPAAEIRAVREESPSNLATLCYKAVEKLVQGADSGCHSEKERQMVLNCSRLLTRVLPYIFEDPDWRGFFWSTVPGAGRGGQGEEDDESARPLAESLLLAIADLLFCPDFTVQSHRRSTVDLAEDVHSLDSCEYIWEAGVGFAHSPQPNYVHDMNRMELLKLLLTCFSEAMYLPPALESGSTNPWVQFFCSTENRHALPLFTSLLNTVCAYDPVGYGIPYNHLLFSDYREPLVEEAAQVLIVTLDHDCASSASPTVDGTTTGTAMDDADPPGPENLFVNYLSRIHREEDFQFILKGIARLLSNPLLQTYLPHSTKKIQFHQELLVLFWKLCDFNKKFLFFVLKSSDVLDILVPILYFLNDARADQSRVGLMHIGVFILLLLSGERNFGVRLNKPYSVRVPMDIPVFTGTHADLLIVVFHKIITSGHQRLGPLSFDCLLTIVVNVSPYLKSLSMVTANKLLHLLEAFSTPWFLFSAAQNHHLVFFLLEVFNNIIQYQFDGNSNLVYAIIRKRSVFHQLANLPTDPPTIHKALQRRRRTPEPLSRSGSQEGTSMEGSRPAAPAEPGTLKTSLVATPGIDKLTEKSQVSEDGTLRSLEPESPQNSADGSPAKGEPSQAWREQRRLSSASTSGQWSPTPEWVREPASTLPLQTIMRLLQVLVPQVEKICIDKGLTDESEILRFLQHGTLVGLLPVPHPILIRKYQANAGTATWFRTYVWGVIYLRNVDPPVWYDTDVKLFEIQRL
ncbi:LOW QUALITY PROTEIN: protein HID1 [Tupaia chinensis]|uniref:LOW QUALITY PROTEIN: protein HID1 n=1 Tax=Tupaia chinensis TaxID=246437 RepID=UPI0003C8CCE4|nr:LOW QUALITY PROTEIN: protein HID1 [Tupaia chinensis]